MKTLKNFAAFACGAFIAVSLTACHHNNEASTTPVAPTTVTVKATKTLVINLSSALPAGATLTYNGVAVPVSGTTGTVNNPATTGTIQLIGAGILGSPISVPVSFGDRNVVVVDIDVKMQEAGVPLTPTTPTTSDLTDNSAISQASSTATFPKGNLTNSLLNSGKRFDVTLYRSAPEPLAVIEPQEKSVSPLALSCEPDGETFAEPVTLKTTLKGANGCKAYYVDPIDNSQVGAMDGEDLTASVSHFSNWKINLDTKITNVEETREAIDGAQGSLKAGNNTISYSEKAGFEASGVGEVPMLVLNSLFGATVKSYAKTINLKSETAGTYKLYQKVKNVTLTCGTQTWKVKVYDAVEAEIVAEKPEIVVPTHNGGGSE